MSTDPLSPESIAKWLKVGSCIDDIQHLIDAGIAQAKRFTGYDYHGKGERVCYLKDWPEIIELEDDQTQWTLEVHNKGAWQQQPAEQIGDVLCVNPPCDCSCDCLPCKGAPRLRLTTIPDCSVVRADVILYVRRFVAYHYMNRGDEPNSQQEQALLKILRPHMTVAFA